MRPGPSRGSGARLGSVTSATYSGVMGRESESGLPVEPVYGPGQPEGFDPEVELGQPGGDPFTRGVYPAVYTARPWTMPQDAGFATPADPNQAYHLLIPAGSA